MGFFDALKKVGGKTKELLDAAAKKYKYAQAVEKAKIELLMRFKMDDLKKICKIEGIPTYYYEADPLDPFSEKKVEIRRKSELVDEMLDIPLDDIIRYAKKYKVNYNDVIEELEELKNQLYGESEEEYEELEEEKDVRREKIARGKIDESFDEILELIEEFEPEVVRNEEDFEKQLFQYLKGNPLFKKKHKIERQVRLGENRIDLVIDDRYAIELKIADRRKKLQELLAQVMEDSEILDEVVAIILDVGYNVDIQKYRERLEKLGARVIILRGTIKRIGRRREIRIKY